MVLEPLQKVDIIALDVHHVMHGALLFISRQAVITLFMNNSPFSHSGAHHHLIHPAFTVNHTGKCAPVMKLKPMMTLYP